MKILFFSCLTLLFVLAHAEASELSPEKLHEEITLSKMVEKPLFERLLFKVAQEKKVCPFRLFTLGIDQWEKTEPQKYENQLRLIASLIQHLN